MVVAAGSFAPEAIAAGWAAVQQLQRDMDDGRRRRLLRLGFNDRQATELSALHTRNFMEPGHHRPHRSFAVRRGPPRPSFRGWSAPPHLATLGIDVE